MTLKIMSFIGGIKLYDLQVKINNLKNNINVVIDNLKSKLTSRGISYPQESTLRYLISLIPLRIFTPINLYASLSGHTAVNIDNSNIIFCGGSSIRTQKLYNTNSNTFINKQDYPNTTIREHGGAKWDNVIYYTGGTSATNKTYAYNIQSNTFITKVDMPVHRSYHTFVATNRFLLMSGGYHSGDIASQYTYDTPSNTYVSKINLKQATDHLSTAHIRDDQVLINGGNDSHNSKLNYIYNIASNAITSKRDLTVSRAYHKSLSIDSNNVLILGGNVTTSNTTQIFSVSGNAFTSKKASPITWSNHTLSIVRSDFLLSGGGNTKQYVYNYQRDTYVTS